VDDGDDRGDPDLGSAVSRRNGIDESGSTFQEQAPSHEAVAVGRRCRGRRDFRGSFARGNSTDYRL